MYLYAILRFCFKNFECFELEFRSHPGSVSGTCSPVRQRVLAHMRSMAENIFESFFDFSAKKGVSIFSWVKWSKTDFRTRAAYVSEERERDPSQRIGAAKLREFRSCRRPHAVMLRSGARRDALRQKEVSSARSRRRAAGFSGARSRRPGLSLRDANERARSPAGVARLTGARGRQAKQNYSFFIGLKQFRP